MVVSWGSKAHSDFCEGVIYPKIKKIHDSIALEVAYGYSRDIYLLKNHCEPYPQNWYLLTLLAHRQFWLVGMIVVGTRRALLIVHHSLCLL